MPTTEAGKWLESEEPYLATWAWGRMGTRVVVAIEAEAAAAERARIRAAVEGLGHVECVDGDCSHDDLSYSQREHPWLDRAAVLAIVRGDR